LQSHLFKPIYEWLDDPKLIDLREQSVLAHDVPHFELAALLERPPTLHFGLVGKQIDMH
jgi:hypothetical protein